MRFVVLDNNDVITAKVSDHHPVIHHGILFWNVMMQCKSRGNGGFNNGFGIVETEKQYLHRLEKIALVIAEIIYRCPTIEAIGLCEGPIVLLHINHFLTMLKQFTHLKRFLKNDAFFQPNVEDAQQWGMMMFADSRYQVAEEKNDFKNLAKLANRFQLWKLTHKSKNKFLALGHFPFGGDEHKEDKNSFSADGMAYCDLVERMLKKFEDEEFIVCADFNFCPYLIGEYYDRILDCIAHHNSVLYDPQQKQTATVDGILLSRLQKQKYVENCGFFGKIIRDNKFLSDQNARASLKFSKKR